MTLSQIGEEAFLFIIIKISMASRMGHLLMTNHSPRRLNQGMQQIVALKNVNISLFLER